MAFKLPWNTDQLVLAARRSAEASIAEQALPQKFGEEIDARVLRAARNTVGDGLKKHFSQEGYRQFGQLSIRTEKASAPPNSWLHPELFFKDFYTNRKGKGADVIRIGGTLVREYSIAQKRRFLAMKKKYSQDLLVDAGLRKKEREAARGPGLIREYEGKSAKFQKVLRKKDTERKKEFEQIFKALKGGVDSVQEVGALAVRRAAVVTAKRQMRTLRDMTASYGMVHTGALRQGWVSEVTFDSKKSGAVTYNEIVINVENKSSHARPVFNGAPARTVYPNLDKLAQWVKDRGLQLQQKDPGKAVPGYRLREPYVYAVARRVRYHIWNDGMTASPRAIALWEASQNVGRNVLNSIYSQALRKDENGKPIGSAYNFAMRQFLKEDALRQAAKAAKAAKKKKVFVFDVDGGTWNKA